MTPIAFLLWALAGAVALVLAATAVAIAVLLVRAALATPLGKRAHDQPTDAP